LECQGELLSLFSDIARSALIDRREFARNCDNKLNYGPDDLLLDINSSVWHSRLAQGHSNANAKPDPEEKVFFCP
jgi:hypothetical protein